jgi:predicted nuclease of predicted toxin-antitoxin system
VKLLADVHIAPRTVEHLRGLGHDVERVGELLASSATDEDIVAAAIRDRRIVLTQDLDLSTIVAVSGRAVPSVLTLRLTSSRIENVNARLSQVLPSVAETLAAGALITVEDIRVRTRTLPVAG